MRYLRKNTATIVSVGPFFDQANGVDIETALTITNERISLVVDANNGSAPTLVLDNITGATSATDNDLNYITNNDAGLMQIELSAANTNYDGRAILTITDAANHVPVFHEFTILPAAVYDSLILGTDLLGVDAQEMTAAKTGYELTAAYDAAKTAATQTSVDDLPTNAELATALGTADDAVLAAVADVPTVAEFEARTLVAASYATTADLAVVDGIADAIKLKTDLIPADPATETNVNANETKLDTIAEYIDTEVAAIKAKTDLIPAAPAAVGDIPSAATIADAVADEVISTGHSVAGSLAKIVFDNLNAPVATVDTVVDAIKLKTDTIPADPATETTLATIAGYVDTEVAAIKAKTDNLPASPAAVGSQMDFVNAPNATALTAIGARVEAMVLDEADATPLLAAIAAKVEEFIVNEADATATITAIATAVNSAVVAGTVGANVAAVKAKTDNLPTDPADQSLLEAAITAATSPLATSTAVADLPTNAELATALGTADDAVLAAVADVPTVAEFEARTLAASEYATASDLAIVDGIVDDILVDTGTTIPATLATLSGEGSGSVANTFTLTDGTNPVADADAWVTTDLGGGNIVAGVLQTNSLGQVTFMLDTDVTYYLWLQKDGFNVTNPTTVVGAE